MLLRPVIQYSTSLRRFTSTNSIRQSNAEYTAARYAIAYGAHRGQEHQNLLWSDFMKKYHKSQFMRLHGLGVIFEDAQKVKEQECSDGQTGNDGLEGSQHKPGH